MSTRGFVNKNISRHVLALATQSVLSHFSKDYYKFLKSQEEHYEDILDSYNFKYESVKHQINYGNESLNKEIARWLAVSLESFLINDPDYEVFCDQIAISKTALNSTFFLYANNKSYRTTDNPGFFCYGETINLFQRSHFNSVLNSETSIIRFNVKDLKLKPRAFFKRYGLQDYDVVFSKLDLMQPAYNDTLQEPVSSRKPKKLSFLTLELIEGPEKGFKHEKKNKKESEIYNEIELLKKRKQQGIAISYEASLEEIKKLNQHNDDLSKKEFMQFLKTGEGKNFLTYGGPITSSFIRTANTFSEKIISFYKNALKTTTKA